MGSGRPYGMLVDSNYYSPGWNTDLRTLNLVLPEREIQVYSSELYEGPVMVAVFNGIYIVTQDYDENPETQQRVDDFIESERLKRETRIPAARQAGGTMAGRTRNLRRRPEAPRDVEGRDRLHNTAYAAAFTHGRDDHGCHGAELQRGARA